MRYGMFGADTNIDGSVFWMFGAVDSAVRLALGKTRYETYLIPGETLIPGGSVSPWYWICLALGKTLP